MSISIELLSQNGISSLDNPPTKNNIKPHITAIESAGIKNIDVLKFVANITALVLKYNKRTAGDKINSLLEALDLNTSIQKLFLFILLPRNLFNLDTEEITFFNIPALLSTLSSHFAFHPLMLSTLTKTHLARTLQTNPQICYWICLHFPEAFQWLAVWNDKELFKMCELPIAISIYIEYYGESLIQYLGDNVLKYKSFVGARDAHLKIQKIISSSLIISPLYLDCDGSTDQYIPVNHRLILSIIGSIQINGLKSILLKQYTPYIPRTDLNYLLMSGKLPVRYVKMMRETLYDGLSDEALSQIPSMYW